MSVNLATTAPQGDLARKTQDTIKQKAVLATAACAQERYTASGTGSLNVPRPVTSRRFRLRRARASPPAAVRRTLRLRLSKKTLRRARRALRRGARVKITVRDTAGNTASRTFTVRAKRPKKRR